MRAWIGLVAGQTAETLIMPYVMSGLTDPINDIQLQSYNTLKALGAEYVANNEEDLKDQLNYGPRVRPAACCFVRTRSRPPSEYFLFCTG